MSMASVYGDLSVLNQPPLVAGRYPSRARVLVLDDQVAIRSLLSEVLTANHYHVSMAKNLAEAGQLIELARFDVLIIDIFLSENESGLSLLPRIRELQPNAPVIVISGMASMDNVIEALKAGAYDMLCKPFNIIDVLHVVSRATDKKRMADENERLVEALRQERDLLEQRVDVATRNLQEKVETLRLLNEQLATMFEMSQATSGDGSSRSVVRQVFDLLGRIVPIEGAYCVIYDMKASDVTLAYADRPEVAEYCRHMEELLRSQSKALIELAESEHPLPLDDLSAAIRQLYPGQWPQDKDLMLMPLHVHQTLIGVMGLLRRGRSEHISAGEERILGMAISHMMAVLEQRQFITRTGQLAGLGELISEIAHDLRHPMTSLRGASRILFDGWREKTKRNRCLEEISVNLNRMESLVSELVNFYNPKEMNMVPVDIHALLDKALEISRPLLEPKGIEVVHAYPESPLMILGLTRNLIEAFINLVSNACQAMEPGGRLYLATSAELSGDHRVRLVESGREPSSYVMIEVTDSGCGIPEENRERIFRRFFTTRPEGHGLGLSAVMRILKKNLGHIHVESTVGVGTTFHVYLPKA
jgi:signal transduction histidine kinase/DNA-binding response OmpR family regulator